MLTTESSRRRLRPLHVVLMALVLFAPPGFGKAAKVQVPNVVGLSKAEARTSLKAAQLSVGKVTKVLSLAVPAGVVVGQKPAAGKRRRPGSKVRLEVAAPVRRRAVSVPATWAGQWLFTVSYHDLATGSLVAISDDEAAICPDDAVGLAVIEAARDKNGDGDSDSDSDSDSEAGDTPRISRDSHCSVEISDTSFDVFCQIELVFDSDCSVDAQIALDGQRSGDSLTAAGEWSTLAVGQCGPLPPIGGETLEVQGTRIDSDPGACDPPRPSLTQQFARHPNLLLLDLGKKKGRR